MGVFLIMAERTSVHFSAIIIRMKLTKENRTHRKTKNILRHRQTQLYETKKPWCDNVYMY